MKKSFFLLLSVITLPVYASGILGSLTKFQDSLEDVGQKTEGSTVDTGTVPEVSSGPVSSSSSAKCMENDQTSLPLNYLTSLILKKDAALELTHDARQGSLQVSSADMIGNCSSMLEWNLKKPQIAGKSAYAVEVKFKDGDPCTADGCVYKVAKVKNGAFEKYEDIVLKPTLKGFEECLEKSGVVVGGKVVSDAIYRTPINEKFSGIKETGKLLFVSHGPSTPMIKAKYGSFEPIHGCDYYETIHPRASQLMTYEDAERERLNAEASKLKDCTINEYYKVADFLEKNQDFSNELSEVRDRLILEAAKNSAAALLTDKYTEDDLKVMSDFDKYIVQPKVQTAAALYEEMLELEGDAKKQKQEELKKVLSEIAALKQKPYFTALHTKKLIKDGKFEEAEKLNTMVLTLESYQSLGSKKENVVHTPEVVRARIVQGIASFSDHLTKERETYEIRTGQITGMADSNARLAADIRKTIEIRSRNFNQEIQTEFGRIQQPNGYCFRYYRNTQRCIEDSVLRIRELQAVLKHYNDIDVARIAEYEAKEKEYRALEKEGQRYIATQNGEEGVATTEAPAPVDTTAAPARAEEAAPNNGVYSFDFNQSPQQQAQMTPQMQQYPTTPYANQNMFQSQQYNQYQYGYQQQQPFLGQQSYNQYGYQGGGQPYYGQQGYNQYQNGYQAGGQPFYGQQGLSANYSFNWGAGAGAQPMYGQQQQQFGYQPYMHYNAQSMYGP